MPQRTVAAHRDGVRFHDRLLRTVLSMTPTSRKSNHRDKQREVTLFEDVKALRVRQRVIAFTHTQFSIIAYLIRHSPRWVTAMEIIECVLQTHHNPDTALVRVHIHAIRQRLADAAQYLQGDRRYWRGYRWCATTRLDSSGSGERRIVRDAAMPSNSGSHALRVPRRGSGESHEP